MVERVVLVKARHLDRPFDGFAAAIQGEGAPGSARDRHDAPIKLRRKFAIDVEFCLAGGLALIQRRIIEKRVAHRALDLYGALAGQEHDRGVGLAAPYCGAAIGRRIAKQGENSILRIGGFRDLCHPER